MSSPATTLAEGEARVATAGRSTVWLPSIVQRLLRDEDLRRSVLSLFDQGIVSGTNFATSVLIGRLCTQSELGVYYLALSVWLFVRGVQEQLVCAPYMIYCQRRSGAEATTFAGSTLAHNGALSLLAVAAMAGLGLAVRCGYGPAGLGTAAWVLLAAMPCLLLREYARHYAFSHLNLPMAIGIDVGACVVQLGGLAVLGYLGWLSAGAAFGVIGVACAATGGMWLWRLGRRMRIDFRRILPDWKHNWSFARWALACHLFGNTTPLVMPWVLAIVSGEAETGVLAACTTILGLANVFVMGLANYLSPKAAQAFASGGVGELRRVMFKTASIFVVTLGGFSLLTAFFGEALVTLVYGDAYAGAGPVVLVLSLSLLAGSLGVTAGNGLWAMERPAANFRADVISFVTSVVATLLLVPPLGVLGVALSMLAGGAVDAVFRTWILLALMRDGLETEARP